MLTCQPHVENAEPGQSADSKVVVHASNTRCTVVHFDADVGRVRRTSPNRARPRRPSEVYGHQGAPRARITCLIVPAVLLLSSMIVRQWGVQPIVGRVGSRCASGSNAHARTEACVGLPPMTPFETLHHICIVVHDIEKSVAYYESIGIGPWSALPVRPPPTMPNDEAFRALTYRVCKLDKCKALSTAAHFDCPQRSFLDNNGEGVFHLGFEFGFADASRVANDFGLEPIMSGQRAHGTTSTRDNPPVSYS